MKANEVKVGTRVSAMVHIKPGTSQMKSGSIISTKVSDGNEVVAIEWDDGKLQKMNINDLKFVDLEEDFSKIASKLREAAASLKEANELANKHSTSLMTLFNTSNQYVTYDDFRTLFNELDDSGWRASTMLCS